jgi:tetratricopeptide (TPR) repeat protein
MSYLRSARNIRRLAGGAVEEHPTREDFARFLQQSPRPSHAERNALIVRHLLAGCAACRRTLREAEGIPALHERLLEIPLQAEREAPKSYNYEWAFAKAERALAAGLARGLPSEQLPKRLEDLARLSEGEQLRRVGSDPRFTEPALILCLIERSHSSRYRSPRRTLHLARLARVAAEALTPEKTGGDASVADLRSRAWGQYANALRIAGRPQEASEAYNAALRLWRLGTGDLRLRAWLLERTTPFAGYLNDFAGAVAMAEEAGAIYEQYDERHLFAGTLVQKAIAQLDSGAAEKAIETLELALPLIDPAEDLYLILAARHNLARCYLDVDRPDEAVALTCEVRELYRQCKDPLIFLRATWQEGQLLREVGHFHNAEAALLRARKGFVEQGLAYETALVSMDLAEVYSKLGDAERVRRVVSEAVPIFRSLRLGREALASLLQLQQAGEPPEVL